MSGIILFLLISLIIAVLLLERVDVALVYTRDLPITLNIELTLFALTLKIDKNERKKKRKSRTLKQKAELFKLIYTFLKELLSRSDVVLFSLPDTADIPFISPMRIIASGILSPIAVAYLKSHASSFEEGVGAKGDTHIEFSFYLYSAFISLALALYYKVKSSFKRRAKNV